MSYFSKKSSFIVIFFTLIGCFLRVYGLLWGAPFYFHPDERNIAYSIAQLSFPRQLNPHFFAYGSLPIYSMYLSALAQNFFQTTKVSFEQAILWARIWSSFLSVLMIPSTFYICYKLWNIRVALFTSFLTTTSIGFIQFAHFGTFEMWVTFFLLWLFYFSLQIFQTKKKKYIFLVGIFLGISIGVKISSLAFAFLPFLSIVIAYRKNLVDTLKKLLVTLFLAFCVYVLTNPFVLFSFQEFFASIHYESQVALGTLPVFYTQEFLQTNVFFQLVYVLPFLLSPVLIILSLLSCVYLCFLAMQTKKYSYFLVLIAVIFLYSSQAILFVKWTRYMLPVLPFLYITLAISYDHLFTHTHKIVHAIFLSICGLMIFTFTVSFFKTAYIDTDTRIIASNFLTKKTSSETHILTEDYDLGILPFNTHFANITLFNFYDLETDSQEDLPNVLTTTDYIVLPSQRVLKTRLTKPTIFPRGATFYTKLLSGELGFYKTYQTPCDIFCKITYANNPLFSYEETANIFDRPIVFIFEKKKYMNKQEYQHILQ